MRMVINGGHCPGKDPGAVGEAVQEADVCRKVMEQVSAFLRDEGHEVASVQADSLEGIVGVSNGFSAELFVAIHCNSAADAAACGTETYFASPTGEIAASCIQRQLVQALGTINRGAKEDGRLYVLRFTDAVAVLVEPAFLSNPSEEKLLAEQTGKLARAIADGIEQYAAMS